MYLTGGFQDTRTNKEDFALTPFLFLVRFSGKVIKEYGIGICWGYYSYFIGLGSGLGKSVNKFINRHNKI